MAPSALRRRVQFPEWRSLGPGDAGRFGHQDLGLQQRGRQRADGHAVPCRIEYLRGIVLLPDVLGARSAAAVVAECPGLVDRRDRRDPRRGTGETYPASGARPCRGVRTWIDPHRGAAARHQHRRPAPPRPGATTTSQLDRIAIRIVQLDPLAFCMAEVHFHQSRFPKPDPFANLCPYGQAQCWQPGRLKPAGAGATIGMRW